jgi:DNA modification methylase
MGVRILEGDCRTLLPTLAADSVHCVVTSPPYWGLRDYGCEGQLGLEPTPEAYVENMVAVFREMRRVLRADGTLWLNMGDSYASDTKGSGGVSTSPLLHGSSLAENGAVRGQRFEPRRCEHGLKQKDLVGMPWRLAFALQADGWYLRADIIWAKPNPMPESVTDRPTKAHEYVFLLSKSARYFYDADAVREPHQGGLAGGRQLAQRRGNRRDVRHVNGQPHGVGHNMYGWDHPAGRNLRSVWSIPSAPFPDAHFATFPPALASRCIQAGSSERGCCRACGAPWEREGEKELIDVWHRNTRPTKAAFDTRAQEQGDQASRRARDGHVSGHAVRFTTTGWAPSCACDAAPQPCTVLDPFAGAGTVGAVAEQLGRHSLLIELSPTYIQMATDRTAQLGLFTQTLPPAVGT